jgi:signal peptidase I
MLISLQEKPMSNDNPERNPFSNAAQTLLRGLWDVVSTVLMALLITLVINTYIAQATTIDGPSMQPNLYYDYRIMMEKVTYHLIHGPRRGDVAVFDVPGEETSLIKRVVALPGETIEVRNGHTYINGEMIEEPWVEYFGGPSHPPTVVPPLHVFVMGDNRSSSRDSRAFGPVHIDQIVGRAVFIYWPPEQVGMLVSW